MIRVIERLQEECDKQCRIILDTFRDERQIHRKVADIKIYNTSKKPIGPQRSGQPREIDNVPDPRELDVVLTELAMISARTHLYYRFIEARANSEVEATKASREADVSLIEKDGNDYDPTSITRNSELYKQVKSLMADFLVMEEYFFRKAIEKAMIIDDYDEGSITSSCVGDVFYILKECLTRALSTSDLECLTSMVNLVNQSLEFDYITLFQKRLVTAFATPEPKDAKTGYMILLNNLDVSCDYMQRLTTELMTLPSFSDDSKDKQLFTQMVKPRIRPILQDAYKDIKYVLSEDEYHEQESNDNNNYNQLMMHILESVTNMLEKTVFGTKFNQYGALRFDKDLRAVNNYFSTKMRWVFRDKMTRLNQISTLLNLESVSYISEINITIIYLNSFTGLKHKLICQEISCFEVYTYQLISVNYICQYITIGIINSYQKFMTTGEVLQKLQALLLGG
ncbi:16996_t:CDS:2 [Racocetra fulgida]|uniref:16996_t:CDS:1 n=1 Tax=Racocetra fulgida TaxID=60492 RepID=A0A9N9GSZ2_9GLOM|nr:16996_t:CDS:2 [Racocetra fulgida]